MKIITNISGFQSEPTTLTVGVFDGIHRGHRLVLQQLVETARAHGSLATLLTFHPHPQLVLQKDYPLQLITTLEERCERLQAYGLDQLVIYSFDRQLADLPAETYVKDILVGKLNVRQMIIGHDHRFGKGRSSGIDELMAFGRQYHFDIEEIKALQTGDIAISSTLIRRALSEGRIADANEYLGYEFSFEGSVKRGHQLGRLIGFPTANIILKDPHKIIPQEGVYAVQGTWQNQPLKGMMNIGVNPTFNGVHRSIEVHWFDFSNDLYDQSLRIYPKLKIRSEQKFDSADALKKQLEKDKAICLKYLA